MKQELPLRAPRRSRALGPRGCGHLNPRSCRRPPRSLPRADAEGRRRGPCRRRSTSPVPRILTGCVGLAMSPAANSVSGFTSLALELGSARQVDGLVLHPERIGEAALGQPAVDRHLAALEARIGRRRRCAPCGPCCPCPTSCPRPEPGPRPTRLRAWCEPAPERRFDRVIRLVSSPSVLLRRRHLDEVAHLEQHAPDRGVVEHRPSAGDAGGRAPGACAAWSPDGRSPSGSA